MYQNTMFYVTRTCSIVLFQTIHVHTVPLSDTYTFILNKIEKEEEYRMLDKQ